MTSDKPKKKKEANAGAHKLADALRPVLQRIARHLKRQAVIAGVSSVDLFILGMVKNRPGIGVSELAEMEDTTRPSMSAHVKRLRAAGWIENSASESGDQRRSNLILTAEGHDALASVRALSNDWLSSRIEALPKADRAALKAAMPALAALLRDRMG